MQIEQAIVVCAFGWGKEFRLYRETLYVCNKAYRLARLTQVRLVTQQSLGVPSARLELRFGRETVNLRGIAAVDDARRAAEYLLSWCGVGEQGGTRWPRQPATGDTSPYKAPQIPPYSPAETQGSSEGGVAGLHNKALPCSPVDTQSLPFRPADTQGGDAASLPVGKSPYREDDVAGMNKKGLPALKFHEQMTRPVDTPHLFTLRMRKEPHTGKGLLSGWRRERMTEQLARADVLLPIAVPVRLQDGEHAYYSSRATRCGEPIKETMRTTYPAQDHGLLILTDRRLLFIGRKSQLVLDYGHLLHISPLDGTLAFEADHWQKRAIFSMPQPETCAARLEAILETTARSAPGLPSLRGTFGNARKLAEREAQGRPQASPSHAHSTPALTMNGPV